MNTPSLNAVTPLLPVVLAAGMLGAAAWLTGGRVLQQGAMAAAAALGIPYNTLVVLLGAAALGAASGLIGAFAVLRRKALVSDAVSHAALPGLCAAYLLTGERNVPLLMLGAAVSGLLGIVLTNWIQRHTRIKADAAIGIVLSGLFGLGIVLISKVQRGASASHAGLESYLFGKASAMVLQDVAAILSVALLILFTVALLYKEFKLLSFDPGLAAVFGWPVNVLDVLMMGLVVTITVAGLPAVGVVLMSALLILPGVAARFWTHSLGRMVLLAATFGAFCGAAGTWASAQAERLPTGPAIVLTGGALVLASALCAPSRGLLAGTLRRWALRRRVARQNLLRSLYECAERGGGARVPVTLKMLTADRGWSPAEVSALLRGAVERGEVLPCEGGWRLSEPGAAAAEQLVRAHRMWELYLVEFAAVAPDHVDRDADEIEHVLPPDVLAQLEQRMKEVHGTPAEPLPESVHPLDPLPVSSTRLTALADTPAEQTVQKEHS